MHLHSGGYSENGHQRESVRIDLLYPGPDRDRLFNYTNPPKRMEPAIKLWLGILNGLGITAWLSAVFLNIGTWKSDILFALAVLLALTRLVFTCIKQIQLKRLRDLELKERQKKYDRDIFS